MNQSKLLYRAEIDGLRAIALISVILYHAQMVVFGSDRFEGGYVGVDIFFVISGYLITRIILSELQDKGSFSFLNFYERRARRILPMLFVVIFASVPYAWQNLLPSDFVEYAESILSTLFFGSNFFFYSSATEYGADSALLKPFLHTWSLGVEEQFYLVFPIVAVVAFKFFRTHLLAIIVALSLLSLQFAELMEVRNSSLNFFLPFSRFWELAIGSLLAYRELNHKAVKHGPLNQVLPMAGLYLVVYAILFFDGKTPHPSFHTILPILGVALIIGFASKDDLVGKILGSKPFVWVGLISYSAYLWHFPIFAFSRNSSTDSSNYDKLEWIFITLFLSVVSYFLIEKPFRNRVFVTPKRLFSSLVISFVVAISFMGYASYSDGIWSRYEKGIQVILKEGLVKYEYKALIHPSGEQGTILRSGKLSTSCNMRTPTEACRYGNEKIVFLGDSYIGHYERAFVDELESSDLGFVSFNYEQCPFVSDTMWFFKAECPVVNELRRSVIKKFDDSKIFIITMNEGQFLAAKKRTDDPLGDGQKNLMVGEPLDSSIAWNSYFESIRWLVQLGHKVVLIRTIPPTWLDGHKWLGDNIHYLNNMDFPYIYNPVRPSVIDAADDKRYPKFDDESVLVVSPTDVMCDRAMDRCIDVKGGYGPLYSGGGRHQSYLGAALMANLVRDKLIGRGWIK